MKVDLLINIPLLARFLHTTEEEEEFWIQFKYERLENFCYKCEMIDHVTRQCNFGKPTMIKAANGLVAKVYNAWLQAEVPNGIFFTKLEKKIG